MKNVKLGLFSLLGLLGAASAFTNVPKHFDGTTYYGVTNGSGSFTWHTSVPSGKQCQNKASSGFYCTIVTINGFTPVDGVVPTTAQANLVTGPNEIYK